MKSWLKSIFDGDIQLAKAIFPFADLLANCPHDPVYHGEGDVWIHTQMVVDCMINHQGFQKSDKEQQIILLLAAFLHDLAKPRTTVELWDPIEKRIRVSQPGHALKGAHRVLDLLWHNGVAWPIIEKVYWLIAWHQKPFHIWKSDRMKRQAIEFSWIYDWRPLLILAEADNLGRISPQVEQTAFELELLRQFLNEESMLHAPYPFANEESRISYFEKPDRYEGYQEYEKPTATAHILSGLPGAGKDTYIGKHLQELPVLSLDAIREEMGILPTKNQGRVVQAALEQAREYLRREQSFVWNAVHISELNRGRAIKLCRDYGFRVEIHGLVTNSVQLYSQNKKREARVPENIIAGLAAKWEPATLLEAHHVHWIVT
ncbi:AAA family ATPase [Bartonella sp. HY406]|uniref:AAA family ATPase n=1 Tax=Bartonella sp. HY406 TaxID=2979331 RepID=UPI0021C674E5|nr:AAA family ATPase [Bartonella sp. HY406]UXN03461.1 AAA family ATPase [Bartonella sp. HY406]